MCVLALLGCATYNKHQQQERFEDMTEAYGNAIRWGKYEVANGFRDSKGKEAEIPDFEYLKNIKVTSYELKAVNISQDGNTVHLDVEIEYYKIEQFIERTITDRQLWKYDEDEERWVLHSTLPDFK
ncbi:MAG: hypothetical protein AMK71_10055 [Nitrospira bacterium SG8_35_4]|nr:MAG: hypothetical protein AMK71_10055 [Nitrospira bacterium SG8_35_4]